MDDITLALNTIVYITIIIFPGILFRKFLFIGKDSKQFYFGNLFERFIWTIFFSIISIGCSGVLYYFLKYKLELPILSSISYTTIKDIYDQLSENNLPTKEKIKDTWVDYVSLLIAIYTISAILGIIFNLLTNRYKSLGLFKHHNYWHDLFSGNNRFKDSDTLTYGYTNADVLIETVESTKLYSGKVSDYFINTDFNLQTLILIDAKRYKKNHNEVEIKDVPGHNFIISNDRIVNINLTYVYVQKHENRFYKNIIRIINFCTAFVGLILIFFVVAVEIPDYRISIFRKIVLIIFGLLSISKLNTVLKCLLTRQISMLKVVDIYYIVATSLPCLWVFNLIPLLILFIIEFVMLLIFTTIYRSTEKDKPVKNIFDDYNLEDINYHTEDKAQGEDKDKEEEY